jgi:hypothetical protein
MGMARVLPPLPATCRPRAAMGQGRSGVAWWHRGGGYGPGQVVRAALSPDLDHARRVADPFHEGSFCGTRS